MYIKNNEHKRPSMGFFSPYARFSHSVLYSFFFNSLFKLIIFNIKIIRARAEPLQPINKLKKKEKIILRKGKKIRKDILDRINLKSGLIST